jgi:hypothetical protein
MSSLIHIPVNVKYSNRTVEPPANGDYKSPELIGTVEEFEVIERQFTTISSQQSSYRFTTEGLRRQSIKHSRNWFFALTILLAVAAGVCAYFRVPYEPLVAVLIATLGIVVVLAMKAVGK